MMDLADGLNLMKPQLPFPDNGRRAMRVGKVNNIGVITRPPRRVHLPLLLITCG